MTTPNYGDPASTGATGDSGAKEQAKATAGTAKEQAMGTAGTAADQGKHVAGVAKTEAQQVAAEAKQQARNVLDDAMHQVHEQSRTQRDRLVETLRTFSDDLERMASGQGGGSGMAVDLARQAAEKARSFSSQLDGREPTELIEEVRRYARRKPGTFLLGALAAGVLAGRLTRGAKDASSGTGTGRTGYSPYDDPRTATTPLAGTAGTATGAPLAGTATPSGAPVYPTGTPLASPEGEPGGTMDSPADPSVTATPGYSTPPAPGRGVS